MGPRNGIRFPDAPDAWELYDLETDPHEMRNITDQPELAATLRAELDRLRNMYAVPR